MPHNLLDLPLNLLSWEQGLSGHSDLRFATLILQGLSRISFQLPAFSTQPNQTLFQLPLTHKWSLKQN